MAALDFFYLISFWKDDSMPFNKRNVFQFRNVYKSKRRFFPAIEPLEERLECAIRVWDGSEIPN